MRQVTHALLTRPPLSHSSVRKLQSASFDLHVLGTPPAFILSQDQTLMLKFWFQSKFRLANFNRSTVVWLYSQDLHPARFRVRLIRICKQLRLRLVSRMFWMFSRTSRLNQKPLFLEFSGFYILFSFQGSLLSLQQQLVYLITTRCVCQQLFLFFQTVFLKLLSVWRSFPQREYYNIKPDSKCQPFFSTFSTYFFSIKFSPRCFIHLKNGRLSVLQKALPFLHSLFF